VDTSLYGTASIQWQCRSTSYILCSVYVHSSCSGSPTADNDLWQVSAEVLEPLQRWFQRRGKLIISSLNLLTFCWLANMKRAICLIIILQSNASQWAQLSMVLCFMCVVISQIESFFKTFSFRFLYWRFCFLSFILLCFSFISVVADFYLSISVSINWLIIFPLTDISVSVSVTVNYTD